MKEINYKIRVQFETERCDRRGKVLDSVNINFKMTDGSIDVCVTLINVHDNVFSDIIWHSACFKAGHAFTEEVVKPPVLAIVDLDTIIYHNTEMEIGKELHLPKMFDRHKVSEAIINRINLIISNIERFKSGIHQSKKHDFASF